jgi:hypothetical protein
MKLYYSLATSGIAAMILAIFLREHVQLPVRCVISILCMFYGFFILGILTGYTIKDKLQ